MDVVFDGLQDVHVGPNGGQKLRRLRDLGRVRAEHDHSGESSRKSGNKTASLSGEESLVPLALL